ncbi:hypothetical protein BDF20DRAFT_890474 [Mycotypha africana]|uniref:uncharacterized protein n=1 Tax=Mycotypha africana TaxID=64632 RepID=UPI002301CD8F|nr:uncharacterized protein BDF20DRAFT_890474 [Mycotypha africana]KAI8970303.1 hypothetical protein BDF20DRAFT_890474 [Mycotypha africana]
MSYDIPTLNALELRKFWKHLLDKYQQSFICGYNLVDWERLMKLIRRNMLNSQAEDVVDNLLITKLNERLAPVDEVTVFFNTENLDIPFGCEPISLRYNFNGERKKLKKCFNIRNQDYVYYGILDFVSKIDENKTKLLLGESYPK